VDRRVLAIAGIGTIGFAALAVAEFMNHTTLADEHVAFGHYEFMLFALVSIVLFGLLGALKPTGWRIPLYATGILALLFAASSLAFPGAEQGPSLGTVGAVAVVLWAIALIGVSEYVERGDSSEPPIDDALSA
jgi:peptidoglycan/LPS O-acetylase OafA/YrhL